MGTIGFVGSQVVQIRLPWSLDVGFTAIVFFGLGYLVRERMLDLSNLSAIKKTFLLTLLLITHIKLALLNGKTDMNANDYGNILYFYVAALAGIGFYVILSHWIPQNWISRFIGQNTIIIMGLSGNVLFVILGLIYLASKPVGIFTSSSSWLAALYCLFEIAFLFPVIYFINRFLPFVIGRDKRPREQSLYTNSGKVMNAC